MKTAFPCLHFFQNIMSALLLSRGFIIPLTAEDELEEIQYFELL